MRAEISGLNKHRVLCIDSGNRNIYEFNEEGEAVKVAPTYGAGFEIWKSEDKYLYPHLGPEYHGICLCDINGNKLMEYKSISEIFTCQLLEDNFVLVGELTEKRIVILNPCFEIEKIIPIKSGISGHEVMRMARKQKDESYLVVHPGDKVIRQYDDKGVVIREIPTYAHTFAAQILPSSNVVYTSQTSVVEIDSLNKIVWEADAKDLSEVSPQWLTGLEILPSGNLMVCNWLGHRREGMGAPLFEINHKKEILWQLRAPNFTKNIANFKLL